SSLEDGKTDITFTCPRTDGPRAMGSLSKMKEEFSWGNVLYDDQVGRVSLVGAGMKSHPGVTADSTEALRDVSANLELISTSDIRISVLVRGADLDRSARALHETVPPGGDEEATVYAGTGR